jgi:hypothetical protein
MPIPAKMPISREDILAGLRAALTAHGGLSTSMGPLIRSERGGPMTPLSIVVWFNRAFRNIGAQRLLISFRPADVHHPGGTAGPQGRWVVGDVQLLGWSPVHPETTQGYIKGDTDVQRKLVAMI